jgi:hypothetical protein
MQKRLAGINPNWAVLTPMKQIKTLFPSCPRNRIFPNSFNRTSRDS